MRETEGVRRIRRAGCGALSDWDVCKGCETPSEVASIAEERLGCRCCERRNELCAPSAVIVKAIEELAKSLVV